MSKKVFHWLIVDIVFAAIVTLVIIWLGNVISTRIDDETIKDVIFVVKTAIWIIVDLIVLFYFLLYWWSDRKWTNIKNQFKKRR